MNALSTALLDELYYELDRLDRDGTVRVVVLRGAGGRAFVAGAHIKEGLADGVAAATIESKTNFFRGAREGEVRGESVPIHVGRHYTVWQTSLWQGDKILAQTTQSQILIQR